MIFELHGDACRLGYLKLVACILEDGAARSPDYLASLLLETCRCLEDDSAGKMLGLLRSDVNARNYVKLAAELGFYDRRTGRLGEFGAVYVCLNSSNVLKQHVAGESTAKLSAVLGLNAVEKLLFIQSLLTKDFYMMGRIIRWALKTRVFSRQQAMETIMEEIYPEALKQAMKHASEKMRQAISSELQEAIKFREARLAYRSKTEWVRSRQYAKYRHAVPPRLEWLVDIGLLERMQRGKYSTSADAVKLSRDLEVVLEKPRDKINQALFNYLAPSMLSLKHPTHNLEAHAMTEVYRMLYRALGKVRLDILCLASAYRLVENGLRSTPSSTAQAFSYLSLLYPDRVFATYSDDGSAEVSGLDISLIE
ncbi:MAG: hypothetical protein QXU87_08610 [Candidatus Caldarchaeum sp.]